MKRINKILIAIFLIPCLFFINACKCNKDNDKVDNSESEFEISSNDDSLGTVSYSTDGEKTILKVFPREEKDAYFVGWQVKETGEILNYNYVNDSKYEFEKDSYLNGKSLVALFSSIDYEKVETNNEFQFITYTNINVSVVNSYLGTNKKVSVPEYFNDNKVIDFSKNFFSIVIKELVLPNSFIRITNYSSAIENLESITIPSSIREIETSAFADLPLKTVIFENDSKLEKIGDYSFKNTKLTSIVIPSNVEKIGAFAFADTKLENILIPRNVEKIGSGAFRNTELESVTFEEESTLEEISASVFYNTKLTNIIFPESIKKIGGSSFERTLLNSITIPKNVEIIEYSAFASTPLNSVTFSKDSLLKEIGNLAFSSTAITSITIPASVETIGNYAFKDSTLSSITISENSKLSVVGIGVFSNTLLTSITLPNSLKVINSNLFSGTMITNIVIPSSVETIYDGAFLDLATLTSISFSANSKLKIIGENALKELA